MGIQAEKTGVVLLLPYGVENPSVQVQLRTVHTKNVNQACTAHIDKIEAMSRNGLWTNFGLQCPQRKMKRIRIHQACYVTNKSLFKRTTTELHDANKGKKCPNDF